jgi:hypothetical protein
MSFDRVIRCSQPECPEPAIYKVAAIWSDRRFSELNADFRGPPTCLVHTQFSQHTGRFSTVLTAPEA